MKQKVYAYFHAGSKNHGCEAIVRATQSLIEEKMILVSAAPEEDKKYGINKIVNVIGKTSSNYSLFEKIKIKFGNQILKSEQIGYDFSSKHECESYNGPGIALSIGGDNYCYGHTYNLYLAGMNRHLKQRGLKTVLWGCSIEPSTVTKEMKKDFANYDLVAARETISYDYLKMCNSNTVLICDPAFHIEKEELPLPKVFVEGKTVGINLSPLIQKSESISGITLLNYKNMIESIIENTDYQIALIPHVVCDGNDDREPLRKLYEEYKSSGRIVMIEDCNCCQLKGYISRCNMFIGARTHATIAAYSSYVPTLVIGYSTKARGIAKDLFGTYDNYVLPVQQLSNPDDMVKAFDWLNNYKESINKHLMKVIPDYKERINIGIKKMNEL